MGRFFARYRGRQYVLRVPGARFAALHAQLDWLQEHVSFRMERIDFGGRSLAWACGHGSLGPAELCAAALVQI